MVGALCSACPGWKIGDAFGRMKAADTTLLPVVEGGILAGS